MRISFNKDVILKSVFVSCFDLISRIASLLGFKLSIKGFGFALGVAILFGSKLSNKGFGFGLGVATLFGFKLSSKGFGFDFAEGVAALFGSIVMIPSVFATMGYNGAIILPKSNATANNLVLVCFFSIICVCGLSCLIIITGQDAIPLLLNAPLISDYLWLVPIYVVLHGMFMTLRFWKIRFHHFENITVSRIAEILGKKAYQISSGSFGLAAAGGLIYGEFISTILKVLILLKGFRLKPFGFTRRIYLKLLATAILYKKFPQYNVWTDLFSRLPALIITYFIIKYFGEGVLGFYGLTLMVLSLPSALFISSVLEAFIPRAAMAKHENKHTELLERLSTRLISIAIFPCLILGIFGDRLFPFVFGSEWLQAGLIAQVLIFKVFFEIITSPSLSLVDIMNKQELNFIRGIMSCLIALAAWLIASYYHDFYLQDFMPSAKMEH